MTELYSLFQVKITDEHIGILWKILATSSIRVNSRIFFKWLKEQFLCVGTKKYIFITNDTLNNLYINYVLNPSHNFGEMEEEGFYIFKSLFIIINEKSHKIKNLNYIKKKSRHGAADSNTYHNIKQNMEFLLYVHPDKLKGIETVWRIMYECNNAFVTEECMIFIGNLYHNISDIIQDQRMEIEEDLVKKSIQQIKKIRSKIHKSLPEHYGDTQIQQVNYQNQFYQNKIKKN